MCAMYGLSFRDAATFLASLLGLSLQSVHMVCAAARVIAKTVLCYSNFVQELVATCSSNMVLRAVVALVVAARWPRGPIM